MANPTILVVDNDNISQEVSKTVLNRLGVGEGVDFAGNGKETIRLYANNKYALIFTDLFFQELMGLIQLKLSRKWLKLMEMT